MTAIPVRTTQARLDALSANLAAEPRTRQTPEERREAEAFAARSLAQTRARAEGALAVPCAEHNARSGQFCWDDPDNGVRGFCRDRYLVGVSSPLYPRQPRDPQSASDDLADRAQAIRYAQRDMRYRERLAERRHVNRQKVGR